MHGELVCNMNMGDLQQHGCFEYDRERRALSLRQLSGLAL